MQYEVHVDENNQHTVVRKDPGNTDDFMYEQIAGIILDENSHGGGDVAIYARGMHTYIAPVFPQKVARAHETLQLRFESAFRNCTG